MKTIILIGVVALLFIVSSLDARHHSSVENMELTDKKAQMFLRSMMEGDNRDSDDDAPSFDTRQAGCVRCKANIALCCAPNFCRKKKLWLDECVEVKPGK